jgi:hypothetical protein
MRKIGVAVLACLFALHHSASFAQSDAAFLKACPFVKGDPIAKVKEFYGIASDPEKLSKVTPGMTSYQYHFEQYGVWVFLDDRLLVNSVRFDRPFAGKIGGVAIGDDKDAIRHVKGGPPRQFQGVPDSDALQSRKQRKLDLLNALPDAAPKSQVIDAFVETARIDAQPITFTTAWAYNAGKPSFVRYDLGSEDDKVQSIIADSCAAEN